MYFQMDAMQAQQQQQADGKIAITATTNVPHPTACTTTTTSTHTFAQNFSTGSATAQNGDISFDMSWLDVPFWMDQSTNTNDTVTVSNTTTNNNGIIATTTTAFHGGGGGGAAVERLPSHNAMPQTLTLLDSTRSAPQQPFPVCQQSMLYADNAHLAMVNTLPLHPLQSSTPYVKQEQPQQQQQRIQSYWFTNSSGNRAYQPATLMTSAVSMVDTPSIFDDNGLFPTSQTQAQPQQPQQQHPQKPISVYTQSHKHHHHHQQFGNTGPMGIQQEQQQQQQQQQQHIQLQQGQQEPSTQPSFSPVSPYTTTSSVESLVVKSSVSEPLVAYPEIYGNNKSEARKRNKSMSWLESQSTQAAASPGPDYTHSKAPPIDWHHIQNDPDAMPRPQKPRYQKDDYSPKWVRYSGHLKEGYCDTCVPGKWLQLKNSAYWYHKQFFHGISSVSGQHFAEPLEQRIGENDVVEGLCHQCGQFVPVCNGRRKNNLLWYRHAHKCHIYDRPAKYNGSSPSTTQKQPIYPAGMH